MVWAGPVIAWDTFSDYPWVGFYYGVDSKRLYKLQYYSMFALNITFPEIRMK